MLATGWIGLKSGYFPARPVSLFQEFVGFGSVGGFHSFGIPLKLFADAHGDEAEEANFGQGGSVLEVGTGGFAAFAGIEPITMVTLGTRQGGWRMLVVVIARTRQENGTTAPAGTRQESFVTDEENPITARAELIIFLQAIRTWRHETAFIPGEFDRRHFAARTEMIGVQTGDRSNDRINGASARGLN